MNVYTLIQQRPLKVKTYTSLTALYEANKDIIRVSKSTLEKYGLDSRYFVDSRIIITKTTTQTSGDVRRSQMAE